MIYNEEATKIDNRESYSIDESVAKMIGWMHGSIRLQKVTEDEYGPILEHLPHLFSLLYPLETHLQLLLDRAKHQFNEALHDNEIAKLYVESTSPPDAASVLIASEVIVNEKYEQISNLNKLTEKSQTYRLMIKQELEKNDLSILRIDQSITDDSGIEYINLNSLNNWAKQFGVNIIDTLEPLMVFNQKQQELKEVVPNVKYISPKRADALNLVLDGLLRENPELKPAKAMEELRDLSGKGVIIEVLDEGVKWHLDDGRLDDVKITSKEAIGERLRYWKNSQSKANPRLT